MWWKTKEVIGGNKGQVSDKLKFISNCEFKKVTY